jgi:4'-phosphopantetheinyl transferase
MLSERIDLYFGILGAVDTPQTYEACFATLSSAEKRRAEYFVFERHRRQYIFAHGLLRVALSVLVPQVGHSDWGFVADRYGRPFIAAPAVAQPVHFSYGGVCRLCRLSL